MSFVNDVYAEKLKLRKSVYKKKLFKRITEDILEPILDNVEDEGMHFIDWAGQYIVAKLQHRILSTTGTSGKYTIVEVTEGGGRDGKNSYEVIGEYRSSRDGMPPNSSIGEAGVPSGTLLESISYEVDSDGTLRYGVLDSTGTEYESLYFIGGKIFVSADGSGEKTSVTDYSRWLDEGFTNKDGKDVAARPWFKEWMDKEVRPKVKSQLKRKMRGALRRSTRRRSVYKAVVFSVYFEED